MTGTATRPPGSVRVLHSDLSVTTRYFHTDNIPIADITDETSAVVERDGYDARGKLLFPTLPVSSRHCAQIPQRWT
jgi:hypothetical protein